MRATGNARCVSLSILVMLVLGLPSFAGPLDLHFNDMQVLKAEDLNKIIQSVNELWLTGAVSLSNVEMSPHVHTNVAFREATPPAAPPVEQPNSVVILVAIGAFLISIYSAIVSNIKLWKIEKQVYLALAEVMVERKRT